MAVGYDGMTKIVTLLSRLHETLLHLTRRRRIL